MKYIVMVNMNFGIDDTFDGEYSGIIHDTPEAAVNEMTEAEAYGKNDAAFNYSYVKEV